MQNSAQFKEGKFVNPIDVSMMAEGSTWKYIKKAYFSKRIDPKPAGKLPMKPIQPNDWLKTNKETISFAWLGHSSSMRISAAA